MATRAERWQNALRRAVSEHVRPIALGYGAYLVASATVPGVGYFVRVRPGRISCTCPAGSWHFPCKHAAAVWRLRHPAA